MTDYETKYKNLVALIKRELETYALLNNKVQEDVILLRDFHWTIERIIEGEGRAE